MLQKTGKARSGSKTRTRMRVVEDGRVRVKSDQLATEEPMEIRLVTGGERQTVAVTMRTPGNDFELAAGFLYGEGIVSSREEIQKISYCVDADVDADQRYNIVNVELRGDHSYDLRPLERHFYTTSACGVCGKASLEQLELRGCAVVGPGPEVSSGTVYSLPDKLREAQNLFESTGRALRRGGRAGRGQGGRRAAQRDGQARRVGPARREAPARGARRHGQRAQLVRDPAEVPDGRGPRRVRRLRAEQPGRGRGQGVRHDARGLPAGAPVQRLRGFGAYSGLRPYPVKRATTLMSVW